MPNQMLDWETVKSMLTLDVMKPEGLQKAISAYNYSKPAGRGPGTVTMSQAAGQQAGALVGRAWDPNSHESEAGLLRALHMRLRLSEGERSPFDHITAHKADDAVFVFVVSGGKPVVLEDGWALYPSDNLVAKLKMLAR